MAAKIEKDPIRAIGVGLFLLLAGLLLYAYADQQRFWKVTDPHDPRFKVETFCFNDYSSHEELAEVLKVVVPIGTPRAEVDRILPGPLGKLGREATVDSATQDLGIRRKINVDALKMRGHRVLLYGDGGCRKLMSPEFIGWRVFVFFDENDRVFQIIVWDEPLYSAGRL